MHEDFIKWLEEGDYLYKNCSFMKSVLEDYIDYSIRNKGISGDICKNFNTVLRKCDEITYEEIGVPEAYVILHFLDRYHRFQLIYMNMFQRGIFPIKTDLKIIDIGTGPGPSMYALSDMVVLFQQFENETKGYETIKNVYIDYAEQASGFRGFLHHATELIGVKGKKSYVPYHHGTYHDASELNFNGKIERENSIISNGVYIFREKFHRIVYRSFDIVIYSNFLTNISVIEKFASQLAKAVFYLKNRGILIIVGGNPDSEKYKPVYRRIDQIIFKQKYSTKTFIGNVKKIDKTSIMKYIGDDNFSNLIKSFYIDSLNALTNNNWDKLDRDFFKIIQDFVNGSKETKWHVTFYKRFSKWRVKKK